MTRTEIMKNNECIAVFGDTSKEMLLLGDFVKNKKILSREIVEKAGCRYITLWVQE